jgi:chemotaxis signal transduction protein
MEVLLPVHVMRGFIPAKIGTAWVVLEATYVREILGARSWVPIPHASPNVPGVLAWRGRAIAVLDLARLVESGEPLRPGVERPRNLVVEARGCTLAIPVDAVHEVRELDASDVHPSHVTRLRHSVTEIELFGGMAAVFDVASVIDGVLMAESDEHAN